MPPIHVATTRLDRPTMEAMLARHHVGRIAFSFRDRLGIRLVNYAYHAGWIYARMEIDLQRTTLEHHQWVAFEVDEVEGIYDWRTLTVHGAVQFLTDDVHSSEWRAYHDALQVLRSVVPSVMTRDDPMPQRLQLFRIYVDEMEGTQASSDARSLPPA
jgi:nitroimidazol reductase NimA-like FMN-containing flavoprotein (pyridoxamine 5'-phosphate oxidase superfamily)